MFYTRACVLGMTQMLIRWHLQQIQFQLGIKSQMNMTNGKPNTKYSNPIRCGFG